MYQDFDYFSKQEKPSFTLCNPDRSELYSLNACFNTQLKLRYNAQSEISFDFAKSANEVTLDAYEYLEGKRQVKIENLGYFIIADCVEDDNGIVPIKHITAYSSESELVYKMIPLISGTYQIYNAANPTSATTILGYCLSLVPNWTIGTVDATIGALYRTFHENDTNVYQFLTTTVAQSCNCVFVFDTLNRTVSVYPAGSTPAPTDIYLSFDNLIKHTQYKEISTEITTCMYCYGGNDLDIRDVNPLGTNAIYNFTYYKTSEWMTAGLISALTAWEAKLAGYQATYAAYVLQLNNANLSLATAQATLVDLTADLAALNEVRTTRIQQGLSTTDIDAQIAAKQVEIDNQNALIASLNSTISSLTNTTLAGINNDLSLTSTANFTAAQQLELNNFIFENTYKNENIIVTDSMTYAEELAQPQELYDIAITVLAKACVPRYQITIDAVNFLALKDYVPFIEQLVLGDQITVDTGKGYTIETTLLEYDFSYDNPEDFKILISNRQRIDDEHFVFTDLIGRGVQDTSVKKFVGHTQDVTVGAGTLSFQQGIFTGGTNLTLTGNGAGALTWEDLTGQTGTTFSLANTYQADSLQVYVNGLLQRQDQTYSEAITLSSLTMLDPILDGDTFIVGYIATS